MESISAEVFKDIADELLERGADVSISASMYTSGGSMSPTILGGDLIHLVSFDANKSKLGDILVYKHGSLAVAHRLVRKYHDSKIGLMLVTAGDGNRYSDAPVSASTILGKVVAIERNGRIQKVEAPVNRLLGLLWVMIARSKSIRLTFRGAKLVKRALGKLCCKIYGRLL